MTRNDFPDSYLGARAAFRRAASMAGCESRAWVHPQERLPQSEPLTIETARAGSVTPKCLLVLLSGMHGVELAAGSALQAGWLDSGAAGELPAGMAVLLVHAVNAFGCWQRRRMTDGNVDLCRNFVDFSGELPTNPYYAALADAINGLPDESTATDRFDRFTRSQGQEAMIAAVMGGQYDDPRGFSYGGSQRTWSAEILSRLLRAERQWPEAVAVLDFHTGVGARGTMTPICLQRGDPVERARNWLGSHTMAPLVDLADQRSLHPALGHPTEEYERIFAGKELTSLVIEFGTLPPGETLPVLLQEHRLTRQGHCTAELESLRQLMWQQHAPPDDDWRQAVMTKGLAAIDRVIHGLAGSI